METPDDAEQQRCETSLESSNNLEQSRNESRRAFERDISFIHQECLDWYKSSKFCDVSMVCSDGTYVSMHQLVLGSVSPLLKEAFLLQNDSESGKVVVIMPDFSRQEVESVISSVYGETDEILLTSTASSDLISCLGIGRWVEISSSPISSATAAVPVQVSIKEEPFEYKPVSFINLKLNRSENDFIDDSEVAEPCKKRPKGRKRRFRRADNGWECVTCGSIVVQRQHFSRHYEEAHGATKLLNSDDSEDDDFTLNENEEDENSDVSNEEKVPKAAARGLKRRYFEVPGGWQCKDCTMVCQQRHQFKDHFKICSSETSPLQCSMCKFTFQDIPSFKSHLNNSGCSSSSTPYFCEGCNALWYNNNKFKLHMLIKHRKEYECTGCEKKFDDYVKFSKHYSFAHSKTHKCRKCAKSFDSEKALESHDCQQQQDSEPLALMCDQCDQMFKNKSSLNYHLAKHYNSSALVCPQCPRNFKSQRGLKYHLNIHNGIADYLCDDCGKGFITRQKLINHRRSKHTFERPYICDQCGEGFVRSDKLVVHKRRVHTGEKPYICEFCEWRGVDSSSLIHHKKKHTNERNRLALSQAQQSQAAVLAVAAAAAATATPTNSNSHNSTPTVTPAGTPTPHQQQHHQHHSIVQHRGSSNSIIQRQQQQQQQELQTSSPNLVSHNQHYSYVIPLPVNQLTGQELIEAQRQYQREQAMQQHLGRFEVSGQISMVGQEDIQ